MLQYIGLCAAPYDIMPCRAVPCQMGMHINVRYVLSKVRIHKCVLTTGDGHFKVDCLRIRYSSCFFSHSVGSLLLLLVLLAILLYFHLLLYSVHSPLLFSGLVPTAKLCVLKISTFDENLIHIKFKWKVHWPKHVNFCASFSRFHMHKHKHTISHTFSPLLLFLSIFFFISISLSHSLLCFH